MILFRLCSIPKKTFYQNFNLVKNFDKNFIYRYRLAKFRQYTEDINNIQTIHEYYVSFISLITDLKSFIKTENFSCRGFLFS